MRPHPDFLRDDVDERTGVEVPRSSDVVREIGVVLAVHLAIAAVIAVVLRVFAVG